MNITDIDDKIIKRARQNHLYETMHERLFNSLKEAVNKVAEAVQTQAWYIFIISFYILHFYKIIFIPSVNKYQD